jgi:catechol 2,3-dioxygenase-like lactoylglutathione lyase family enzyme
MREVFGGVRVVALPVRSVARARRFYVERLGFRLLQEEAGRFAMVNLGSVRLCLDVERETERRGTARLIFQSRSLGRTARELDDRGVAYEQHTGPRAGDYLEVGDPDGNRIVFTERI